MSQQIQEVAETEHSFKRGVLLLAVGSAMYGRFAWNLAVTIKAVEPDMPVCIAYSPGSLNYLGDNQRKVFNIEVQVPNTSFGSKFDLYDLSPFDETLYIDADTCWLPRNSVTSLMMQLNCDFTAITEGKDDDPSKHYQFWADLQEIREVYSVNKIYQWRSEVMFWKKCDKIKAMFDMCKTIYRDPQLKTLKLFAGNTPDELALNIACSAHDINPHQYKWQPSYWERLHGYLDLERIYSNYYLLSCGSNIMTGHTKDIYNRIVKASCYKLGYQHVFPAISKMDAMKDRQKM